MTYTGHILKHTLIGKKNTTHYFLLLKYSDNIRAYLALLISSIPSEYYVEINSTDIPILTHKSYVQMENMHTIKHSSIHKSHIETKISSDLYRKIHYYWRQYISTI